MEMRGESMSRKVVYPRLEECIAGRGILKTEIAAELGITPRTLSQKLKGTNGFSWDEVKTMQKRFFPDVDKDTLMQRSV